MTAKHKKLATLATRRQKFIDKSILVHGKVYDYSMVEYVDPDTPVKIICPVHGITLQKPKDHVRSKRGCHKCGMERMSDSMRLPWDIVLGRFKDAHGDKYTYDNSVYMGMFKSIVVTCKEHGDFKILPSNHANGQGCVECHRAKFPTKEGGQYQPVKRKCERLAYEENNRPDFSKLNAWRPIQRS